MDWRIGTGHSNDRTSIVQSILGRVRTWDITAEISRCLRLISMSLLVHVSNLISCSSPSSFLHTLIL